jgi:hypothetical protein
MLQQPFPVIHQEVMVALVNGLQRSRICSVLSASNAAIRWLWLCLLLDCGGRELFVQDCLPATLQ